MKNFKEKPTVVWVGGIILVVIFSVLLFQDFHKQNYVTIESRQMCRIDSVKNVPLSTLATDKLYKYYTSCGTPIVSKFIYKIGDSIDIKSISYKSIDTLTNKTK